MPIKCYISLLVHVHGNYVSVYILQELIEINNMTKNTGIHTFHITCICPMNK